MKILPRALLAGTAAVTLAATFSGVSAPTAGAVTASKATSAAGFGGMKNLIRAAKKEGTLNVITLPANWANYGNIIRDFSKKYGIKVNSENPDGTSADEIEAVTSEKGQSRAPDVLDVGPSFALSAASSGLLAPYKVQSWKQIPNTAKASNGDWFDDYGGYVAIGYNSKVVKTPPTSFADLLKPAYKNEVALNGNPTQAGAAFAAVYAAALANGGTFNNILPGVKYFQRLAAAGNFVPVTGSPSTVESGQTPILVWWDYLQASEVASSVPGWKVVIPTDGHYASYYCQAISAYAPDPAAARLWEEYLYSVTGQNLWLKGAARPIELASLVKNGTVNRKAYNALPAAPRGAITFPTQSQLTAAETVVTQNWSSVTSG